MQARLPGAAGTLNDPVIERRPGFRNPRSLLLAEASVLLLVGFCFLPADRLWFDQLLKYCGQVSWQLPNRSVEYRMDSKLRLNYSIPRQIAAWLKPGDIFLLPPVEYARAHLGEDGSGWEEPKYFYYMAGPFPTVTVESPRLREATCSVLVDEQGQLHFIRFRAPGDLDRVLRAFVQLSP